MMGPMAKTPAAILAMPDLSGLTERERTFAEAYFEVTTERGEDVGCSVTAYRRAFPLNDATDTRVRDLAHSLLRNDRVSRLVAYLRANMSMRAMVPAQRVVQEVERIAFSNVLDYLSLSPDGTLVVDPLKFSKENSGAIASVEITETKKPIGARSDGEEPQYEVTRHINLKMHGKLQALEKLLNLHKLYKTLSIDDLERLVKNMADRLEDNREFSRPLMIEGDSGGTMARDTLETGSRTQG